MSRFDIAMVRFTPNGRAYPFNYAFREEIKPAANVVVRWEKQGRRLQVGEVVEVTMKRQSCTNSIVCMEAELQKYGRGPDGVENLQDLHEYLTFLGWTFFEAFDDSVPPGRLPKWPSVYVMHGPMYPEATGISGPQRRIHIGVSHISPIIGSIASTYTPIGRSGSDDTGWDKIVDGKLRVSWIPISRLSGTNPCALAAKWAEELSFISIETSDNKLSQIQRAISPDGGPAYLCDDVWLP